MPEMLSPACERTHWSSRQKLFRFHLWLTYLTALRSIWFDCALCCALACPPFAAVPEAAECLAAGAVAAFTAGAVAAFAGTAPVARGKPEPYLSVSRSDP
eukprot:6190452-Pleurochrysis_carterae.AAC.4